MSDILIKNMNLPNKMECLEILLFHDGYTTYRVHERDEWTSTKAIELPPHGRLIDADALPIKDEWALVGTDVIWNAPTVLEASDE